MDATQGNLVQRLFKFPALQGVFRETFKKLGPQAGADFLKPIFYRGGQRRQLHATPRHLCSVFSFPISPLWFYRLFIENTRQPELSPGRCQSFAASLPCHFNFPHAQRPLLQITRKPRARE